jgi:hypothetical protein
MSPSLNAARRTYCDGLPHFGVTVLKERPSGRRSTGAVANGSSSDRCAGAWNTARTENDRCCRRIPVIHRQRRTRRQKLPFQIAGVRRAGHGDGRNFARNCDHWVEGVYPSPAITFEVYVSFLHASRCNDICRVIGIILNRANPSLLKQTGKVAARALQSGRVDESDHFGNRKARDNEYNDHNNHHLDYRKTSFGLAVSAWIFAHLTDSLFHLLRSPFQLQPTTAPIT